jgi:hypothetical protein
MSTDLTPEHSARPLGSPGFPEVVAAYRYVDSVVQHADAISPRGGHAWHGWALREAFLAGCTHYRENGGYIVPTPAEVAWKEAPPERLEQFSSATQTLGRHLDELCEEHFRNGSVTALKALEAALKGEWMVRLAFRISPMIVLRKFRERIEKEPSLDRGSESSLSEFSDGGMPLG